MSRKEEKGTIMLFLFYYSLVLFFRFFYFGIINKITLCVRGPNWNTENMTWLRSINTSCSFLGSFVFYWNKNTNFLSFYPCMSFLTFHQKVKKVQNWTLSNPKTKSIFFSKWYSLFFCHLPLKCRTRTRTRFQNLLISKIKTFEKKI